jgi:hypothetical protein
MAVPHALSHLLREISEPLVCAKCADEVASGAAGAVSMRDYGRLEAGFTERGLQVWCMRHDLNVVHVDFAGATPEADFRCLERRVN